MDDALPITCPPTPPTEPAAAGSIAPTTASSSGRSSTACAATWEGVSARGAGDAVQAAVATAPPPVVPESERVPSPRAARVLAWRLGDDIHLVHPGAPGAVEVRELLALREAIRPPAAQEVEQLTALISQFGCLEPITLWPRPDHDVLIDGHTRIEVCRNLGLKLPGYRAAEYADEDAAIVGALDLQIGRRNIGRIEQIEAAIRAEPVLARDARRRMLAGKADPTNKCAGGETRELVARRAGTSHATVNRVKKVLAHGDPSLMWRMRAGEVSPTAALREIAAREKRAMKEGILARIRSAPPPLPRGPFRVIFADPPWRSAAEGDDPLRSRCPYPTMSLEEIMRLPVGDLAAPDAIVVLWGLNSMISQTVAVAHAWGFEVKTMLVWVKPKSGTGCWLRSQSEYALICTRGKPVVTLTTESTVLHAPVGRHSEKPEAAYQLIESLCPGSKLELFARKPRLGWVSWGAEV